MLNATKAIVQNGTFIAKRKYRDEAVPGGGTAAKSNGGVMSFGRDLYHFLLSSSQAYAKWDLEVSTSIIKNRKKLLILLALAAPILLVCGAEAYEAHEMLG